MNPTPPIFHSYESRWLNLKMGETYPIPYEGLRFPVEYYDQLMMDNNNDQIAAMIDHWLSEKGLASSIDE